MTTITTSRSRWSTSFRFGGGVGGGGVPCFHTRNSRYIAQQGFSSFVFPRFLIFCIFLRPNDQDKQHFKDTLGTKKRWPMAVVVGTLMDFEFYCPPHCHSFSLNYLPVTNRLKGLGMTPFEPPDVSGWDLQTVWTADRLTSAHDFMQTFVRRIVINGCHQ